ncbi:hypothetical protein FOXYSP1_10525 [Fusarium oxysporum f. sp. phaseoli]
MLALAFDSEAVIPWDWLVWFFAASEYASRAFFSSTFAFLISMASFLIPFCTLALFSVSPFN